MTVTTSVFPEVCRCDVIQILTLIIWNSTLLLQAFYEGDKPIWPSKPCTADYCDAFISDILHELKWERPKSIVITKKRMGQKYL